MDRNNQNFDEIKRRLLYFAENTGIKKMDFYKKIGLKQSNFSGEGAASSLKSENIIKVLIVFPEINPDWLLLGKGEMLRSDPPVAGDPTPAADTTNDNVSRLIDILQNALAEKDRQIETLLNIVSRCGSVK